MLHSEQIGELSQALCKAQKTITTAKANQTNPHFQSSYADLASVWEACRQQLSDNDLAVFQIPMLVDGQLSVQTKIVHKSGQWIQSTLPCYCDKKMQSLGSAITYARRYSLAALVGVAPEDDDDGNASTPSKPQQNRPAKKPADKPKPQLTIPQLLMVEYRSAGWTPEMAQEYLGKAFKKENSSQLDDAEMRLFYEALIKHKGDFPTCMQALDKPDPEPPPPSSDDPQRSDNQLDKQPEDGNDKPSGGTDAKTDQQGVSEPAAGEGLS